MININPNPRFTDALIKYDLLKDHPFVIVDVGAACGFEGHWNTYKNNCKLIGFEPDANECQNLNQSAKPNSIYYPVALSNKAGRIQFNGTKFKYASGFLHFDGKEISRFEDAENAKLAQISWLDVIDYDTFASNNKLPPVDFMKLDTEGSELDILNGAERNLTSNVLGVSLEMLFQKWRVSQPVFSDIDIHLRSLGFRLYDFSSTKHARKVLPPYPTTWRLQPYGGGATPVGQVIIGDFLYFRDPIQEMLSNTSIIGGWDTAKLLKIMSLYELFNLNDCAVELLLFALEHKLVSDDCKYLLDLLVPPINNQLVTYEEYMRLTKNTNLI